MIRVFINKGFAAGLGLVALCAAAPIALADPPGYYFQDWQRPTASASVSIDRTQSDAQIDAVNRKAEQALATAQQALREAEQTVGKRGDMAASLPARLGGTAN